MIIPLITFYVPNDRYPTMDGTSIGEILPGQKSKINHHIDRVGDFKQIVYIVVSTSPNDNFNALYISIGKAIDNALSLVDPIYEKMLSKDVP